MESVIKNTEYDYGTLKKTIEELVSEYPFLESGLIGRSCAGRNIPYLKLGEADEFVLFVAAVHGSEHITTNVILTFLEELCFALKSGGFIAGLNAKKAMQGRSIIVVPCVNPDGVEISIHGATAAGNMANKLEKLCKGEFKFWNANLRGVDINHNFDAGWQILSNREKQAGIYGPSMTRFGGFSPMSEPETIALAELCNTYKIRHVVALHSQGEVIYWNYGSKPIPRAQKMAEIMATSSGYALDVPTGLALGGGFKDWFIDTYSRPGFTVEIGKGKNPLPTSSVGEIYLKIREMLMLVAIM